MLRNLRDKATNVRPFKTLGDEVADKFHKTWHERHPETRRWHNWVNKMMRRHRYVQESLHGRKRFFWDGATKKNAPPNARIQPKAAGIANRGIIAVDEAIPFKGWSEYSGVFCQVHDWIGVVTPEDRAEEARHILNECIPWQEPGMSYPGTAEVTDSLAEQ